LIVDFLDLFGRNIVVKNVLQLTLTAARAKLRRRAKRPPQFGVGLADSLGIILSQSLDTVYQDRYLARAAIPQFRPPPWLGQSNEYS
jgi:hypothetical protein